jgi:hypothetical protein
VSISTLDLTPRVTARGVGSNAVPPFSAVGQALARAGTPDYFAWLEHVRPAAGCTRPIRLVGHLDTINPATGQRLDRVSTDRLPDAAIYKACGNRRSSICPSCAQTYQRDAYQLLRAGLVGGKGIPTTVATHGADFVTLTAPSFGPVHARVVRNHTCVNRRRCDCRPDPCHARRDTPTMCQHGNPVVCWARHEPTDAVLGRPFCLDCYDHDHQVVWNHHAGELWRRTKQAIERHLATLCRHRRIPFHPIPGPDGTTRWQPPVRVSHGKAAEFQTRGAVHFHALLRLDGVDPDNPDRVLPPPAGITVDDLDDAVRTAAATIIYTTPPHPDQPAGWHVGWGEQVDIRHINLTGRGDVTDDMVAGYLAKYATKSTEATGHNSTRITADTVDMFGDAEGDHIARLIDACWRLGRPTGTPTPLSQRPQPARPTERLGDRWTCPTCRRHTRLATCPRCTDRCQGNVDTKPTKPSSSNPYAGLRRWAHMLGFGGHFLTKARRYSITFTLLRDTRIQFRRAEQQDQDNQQPGTIRTADHLNEETTLIVGTLTFAGVGWHTTGDALLANTAADQARSRQATGREELAHEIGIDLNRNRPRIAA